MIDDGDGGMALPLPEGFEGGTAVASLVHFRKVAESGRSVEYAFGFDATDTPRTLVMDTRTRRAGPSDGVVDHAFLKASRRINAMYDESARWPDRGLSAS
ncbi:hypothetical protein [Streptomyces sp. NPDC046332]|uniref:hypothetical protein n=1 Tax=unclassified Streptomyces TaxID=2593676 RepID=UPI003408165A